ncbi:MAG: aminotransferase class V-fold PLP-dependent enzyme [Calditrichaeota bacterium]|nr:MAG: aminotransferase class V-fold PLP-dependent enzyme [Calditrichota bacterium]
MQSLLLSDETASIWQSEFPILRKKIHVANCSQSPQSKRVREAINQYLNSWRLSGMDWDFWLNKVEKARSQFARLINASPEEIAISTSASEATSSIASALRFSNKRNRIVTTEAEFPTVAYAWLALQKFGYEVKFIPVRNGKIHLEDYEALIDEDTRIVSATHVYYLNGFKQDIKSIVDLSHRYGAWVFVDAYQSLGTCEVDVKALDIDILISGNLKYLLGIPGIAFIYVKKEIALQLEPTVTGWFGQENPFSFNPKVLNYASNSRRFETGTPPILNAFAAYAGLQIIHEVGTRLIEERIQFLSKYTVEKALGMKLNYVGPDKLEEKGAITAIQVSQPYVIEQVLKEHNIIASARGNVIRIAPHFFTTTANIDKVLKELKSILNKG